MTTFRNISFLVFVVSLAVAKQAIVQATATCTTVALSQCPNNENKYGKFCVWDKVVPVQSCADFYGDLCSGYCDDGNPNNQPDYDTNVSQCTTDPSALAVCWCKGWQPCPPPEEPEPTCEEQCDGDPQCICEECDGDRWIQTADGLEYCEDIPTPIFVDIASSTGNYNLSTAADGVLFDVDADGVKERVAWPEDGSKIGLLARDLNQNGLIDSGAELLGDATAKRDGTRARHGFDALLDIDAGGFPDGQLTEADGAFSTLRVWFDANRDGVSDAGELVALRDAGISAIATAFQERKRRDPNGNWYRYEGRLFLEKNGRAIERRMTDVLLTTIR